MTAKQLVRRWVDADTPQELEQVGELIERARELGVFPAKALRSPSNTLFRAILVEKTLFEKGRPLTLKNKKYSSWTYDLEAAKVFGDRQFYWKSREFPDQYVLVILKRKFQNSDILLDILMAAPEPTSTMYKEKEIIIKNQNKELIFSPNEIALYKQQSAEPYYSKVESKALYQKHQMQLISKVGETHANSKNLVILSPKIVDVRQATPYTCGVSCVQAILNYYGIDKSEGVLAKQLGATEEQGTSPQQIIKGFKHYGLVPIAKENTTLKDIRVNLEHNIPTMVAVQAWSKNPVTDWQKNWEDGHWVIITGMDGENIIFEDPSLLGKRGLLTQKEFLTRWHDYQGSPPYSENKSQDAPFIHLSIAVYPPKKQAIYF